MKRQSVLAILALSAFGSTLALNAQDWQVTRTEWGDPDLEGVWISANDDGLPFQRVDRDTADAIVLRELVDAGAVEAGLLNEGVPPGPRPRRPAADGQ